MPTLTVNGQEITVDSDTTVIQATEKLGKPLFIWGANDKDSIQKLINDRVAGIMTDRPDLF